MPNNSGVFYSYAVADKITVSFFDNGSMVSVLYSFPPFVMTGSMVSVLYPFFAPSYCMNNNKKVCGHIFPVTFPPFVRIISELGSIGFVCKSLRLVAAIPIRRGNEKNFTLLSISPLLFMIIICSRHMM
jgi:hypothetical protein